MTRRSCIILPTPLSHASTNERDGWGRVSYRVVNYMQKSNGWNSSAKEGGQLNKVSVEVIRKFDPFPHFVGVHCRRTHFSAPD